MNFQTRNGCLMLPQYKVLDPHSRLRKYLHPNHWLLNKIRMNRWQESTQRLRDPMLWYLRAKSHEDLGLHSRFRNFLSWNQHSRGQTILMSRLGKGWHPWRIYPKPEFKYGSRIVVPNRESWPSMAWTKWKSSRRLDTPIIRPFISIPTVPSVMKPMFLIITMFLNRININRSSIIFTITLRSLNSNITSGIRSNRKLIITRWNLTWLPIMAIVLWPFSAMTRLSNLTTISIRTGMARRPMIPSTRMDRNNRKSTLATRLALHLRPTRTNLEFRLLKTHKSDTIAMKFVNCLIILH